MKLKVAAPVLGIFGAVSSFSMMSGEEETVTTKLQQKSETINQPTSKNSELLTSKNKKLQATNLNSPEEKSPKVLNKEVSDAPSEIRDLESSAPSHDTETSLVPKVKGDELDEKSKSAVDAIDSNVRNVVSQDNGPKAQPPIQKPVSDTGVINPTSLVAEDASPKGEWRMPPIPMNSSDGRISDCSSIYFIEGGVWLNGDLKSFKSQFSFETVDDLLRSNKWGRGEKIDKDLLRCGENKKYLYAGRDQYGIPRKELSDKPATFFELN